MIKLSDLILEASGRPKAVIMAGGAGSGKTYLLKQLSLTSLVQFNPDKYIEDPSHPYHNNLGAAAKQTTKDVQAAAGSKTSFVWDTTASGVGFDKTLVQLLEADFDIYMVMVYSHPMISYISNFARAERNVPRTAVFSTWRNAYQKIGEFNQKLKGQMSIFVNDFGGKYDKPIEAFNAAAKNGASGIKEYLDKYNQENGIGGSSFFKPVVMDKETEQEFIKHVGSVQWDKDNRSEDKAIKNAFLKFYDKNGVGPGQDKLKDAVTKSRESKIKQDAKDSEIIDNIADMIYSPLFQEKLQHSTPKEIDSKLQSFLA
tara:strand:+ start:2059 stop:3000 length:942 start_codon:yes stop_codon:yes gene_type:complete